MVRKYIEVKGIVQGVGFRPFVYKLALENSLKGWVNNTSLGVYIDIEGSMENLDSFIFTLTNNPPPLSKISEIVIQEKSVVNYDNFEIRYSEEKDSISTLISPDFCTCDDCKDDIMDPNNRRYRYPFTNCTNCGPRFTIIKKLPYDRPVTTMADFEMCDICKEEYTNPLDRRFHAQPNACSACGPKVWLVNNKKEKIDAEDSIKEAISLIKSGKILAVKGLGGFHLVCDGTNEKAIQILRDRKNRPMKPLAVMVRDLDAVKKYCYLSKKEEEVILSNKRPITILNKKKAIDLPGNITTINNTIGVMLPYTPLHYLLFDEEIDILVMTSANISGEPMIYKNEEALIKLNNIVDYFLLHNREIYLPVDDSVCRVILEEERVIRPARGYAPISVDIKKSGNIISCGSHLKNTLSISNNDSIFISQYIGDMENLLTYETFEKNLEHFKQIYKIDPKVLAYDMHPDYWCRELVNDFKGNKVEVQHHHAHIVSCMAENNISEDVIGVAYDGTGYGIDGNIWGAEFLICNLKEFARVGHLNYLPLPGGESAIKEPWKIAIGQLYKTYGQEIKENLPYTLNDRNINILTSMIKNKINSPLASSMGRLFDGVSALLGFSGKVTFEGEAAIYLENIAQKDVLDYYKYSIEKDKSYIINTDSLIKGIVTDLKNNVDSKIISMKFHNTIIRFTVELCEKIRTANSINKVALSGGVFHNEILLEGIYSELREIGFEVYTHKIIPNNDSGVSLGQLIVARENI